ncbi:S9 family peptidase [Novosphingobium sp. MW5]|nr:S9 family peptidase [Novosphingobium sp. MW5]
MRKAAIFISAFGLPLASAQAQTSPDATAAKFGALQGVSDIAMSPDGNWASIVAPRPGGGQRLFIADLVSGGAPKPILAETGKEQNLRGCRWATDTRLVCTVSVVIKDNGVLIGFSRLIALNKDGSGITVLSKGGGMNSTGYIQNGGRIIDWDLPGKPGKVLVTRQFVPEVSDYATNITKEADGIGVEELDITSLSRKVVERPKPTTAEFLSDGKGNVRIMGSALVDGNGRLTGRTNYYYRKQGSREWELLSKVSGSAQGIDAGFDPYAIDPAKNVVYGFENKDGFTALSSVSLDGTATKQLVLSRSDVDIDGLVRIGRDGRVVGASYATERRTIEFFDPDLKKLGAALKRALPGNPNIDFLDSSADESRLLLFASGDTNPGMIYVYDKTTRKLAELLPARPELAGVALGTMAPITYTAADGTKIPGYLTLPPGSTGKNLPAIVMPHGGPSARDEWGFDWLAQYFATKGFAVLQPNFRGSAGYGADFYQRNGFQSWKTAIGDVNDAGRWLLSQGIAAPGKLAVVGWSYGGYAALQSPALEPDLFKAIVAIAPVTDLEQLRTDASQFTSSRLVSKFIGSGPHVREGSPAQNVGRIRAPVLLFHGDLDQNVNVGQSRLMNSKLKGESKTVEYVEFPGLDHYLYEPAARTEMLTRSDAFLRKALGL